jgi:hypothetical protein
MDQVISSYVQMGALGVTSAALFTLVVFLIRRLFTVVENNTKAMTELKDIIDKCQITHGAKQ